ncbi:3'-5' exonuclease [Pantoea dispersa]|uniref:3'-5' exonuclease n=1 Tax=Pantoea TaxID=53335 RepID=UPI0012324021|nr:MULTISPECIES: 3'-5' exonuclease [unclassified Pantoea]KAA6099013.1 3'-5' exonuclease [Pantoea sp. B_9]KAA6115235.1 3'-5' exonuclease [Pantoea sp. B_10]NIE52806.1 3'-5' exonuclease [Pantoea sp. Ap-870]
MSSPEIYISVDIETTGPIPGEYDLISIGACVVGKPEENFSCLIKPQGGLVEDEALAVTGLNIDELNENGKNISIAIELFDNWLKGEQFKDKKIVFVGFNAAFDWSFINYAFIKQLGKNPFGFTALDIKSYYMGKFGTLWQETKSSKIDVKLKTKNLATHNALQDAIYQSEIFNKISKK